MPLGTPREKDFETVKKTIRSLLLSAKNGLTPVQLTKDYMAMIGNPIPVQELGFPSLFELLKHMPDAVAMHKSRGGTLMLRGLASDSCIHVAQLVSRQKATKSYTAMKSGMRAPTSTKRVPAPTIPPRSKLLHFVVAFLMEGVTIGFGVYITHSNASLTLDYRIDGIIIATLAAARHEQHNPRSSYIYFYAPFDVTQISRSVVSSIDRSLLTYI
uniref:HTH OST-type domain-containing protein n=1 Tax=Amphimedon queenslandica TaxID=400682 RepID=A0A1X7TGF6_AMPQE